MKVKNDLVSKSLGFTPVNGGLVVSGNRGTNFTTQNPNPPTQNSSKTKSNQACSFNPFEKLRNYLFFEPSKEVFPSVQKLSEVKHEEVFIDTPDGERLHGYFLPAKVQTDKVMLYLHGNDENVSRWVLGPMNLQEQIPVNALIVDYRGYGKSTGSPSCEGVVQDSLSMYQYLIDKGFKPENISLYGRSLGGAIALELASRVKIKSLVVQSSFLSVKDLVKAKYHPLVSLFVKSDYFNSKELIQKINVPILISHGSLDELVPLSHPQELYRLANRPKKLIILNGAGHRHLKDYYTQEYFDWLRRLMS